MKKIALILTLFLLSACAKPVETVKSEETLYRVDSSFTFSVPTSGYTMSAGAGEGVRGIGITYDNSDLELRLMMKTDRSQDMEGFDLEPLSVRRLLNGFTEGSPAENCYARFAEKGSLCSMADEMVEVVLLEGGEFDEYLVITYPYGKGDGVAGLYQIFESINLDPTDQELASATSVSF